MLNFEPNIVFIDDKPSEVMGIVEEYRKEGIGVKYFNADAQEGDTLPTTHFSDVNLLFLDLYLDTTPLAIFNVEDCGEWVKAVLPEYTFYVLVIWSKDTHHKAEVLEHMTKIKRPPYLCIDVTKNDEFKSEDNSWDFPKLYTHVSMEIAKKPELEELALWKKSIKASSNLVIGHLAKDLDYNLGTKLQKIIVGHGGTSLKTLDTDDANQKREVLFDALDNVLIANAKGTRPLKEISENNLDSLYSIPENIQTDIDSKLNSWFHFNITDSLDSDCILPGLICTSDDDTYKETFTLKDDPKLLEKLAEQNSNSDTVISDIVVVLNRPCDIAQDKFGKNVKLLSGIKILNPKRYIEEELNSRQRRNRDRYLHKIKFSSELPDSSKLYDHLYLSDDESDIAILFDFRYVFSVPIDDFKNKFTNIKVFNKELTSEIQVEYSSYSSRLGITQII